MAGVDKLQPHRTPLVAAGLLLGAGLGGFVDGIALHHILQLHNMLSGQLPPDTLVRAKVNMYWDGLFNVVEDLIDHELLGLHHVYEYTPNHLPADLGFLAFGVALGRAGGALVRAGRA